MPIPLSSVATVIEGQENTRLAGWFNGKRAVLLRLQNNIKVRRLREGDLSGAVACTEDMLRIAPDAAPLWREAGLMHQRLGHITAAIMSLERFLALAPDGPQAFRVRGLLEELRQRLN